MAEEINSQKIGARTAQILQQAADLTRGAAEQYLAPGLEFIPNLSVSDPSITLHVLRAHDAFDGSPIARHVQDPLRTRVKGRTEHDAALGKNRLCQEAKDAARRPCRPIARIQSAKAPHRARAEDTGGMSDLADGGAPTAADAHCIVHTRHLESLRIRNHRYGTHRAYGNAGSAPGATLMQAGYGVHGLRLRHHSPTP